MEEIIRNLINLENTYIGEAPVDVDNCQWIMAHSGAVDNHFQGDTYDKPEYKICVRNTSNFAAKNIIYDIYKKLQNHVGGNYVIIIDRLPYYISRDDKYRCVYALKIEIQLGGY